MVEVRIYQPAKTAMQSGRGNVRNWVLEFEPAARKKTDSLMGWVGSADTQGQVKMRFTSKEEAIDFAERKGLRYSVAEPKKRRVQPKNYSDNFAFNRPFPWTH